MNNKNEHPYLIPFFVSAIPRSSTSSTWFLSLGSTRFCPQDRIMVLFAFISCNKQTEVVTKWRILSNHELIMTTSFIWKRLNKLIFIIQYNKDCCHGFFFGVKAMVIVYLGRKMPSSHHMRVRTPPTKRIFKSSLHFSIDIWKMHF